jgi:pentatricopeptide repeat protein
VGRARLIGKVEGAAAAVEVLSEAREAGVRPNRYMYNAALRVCADAGEHSRLLSLASAMRREGVFWDDMTRSLVADAKEQEHQEGR